MYSWKQSHGGQNWEKKLGKENNVKKYNDDKAERQRQSNNHKITVFKENSKANETKNIQENFPEERFNLYIARAHYIWQKLNTK